MKTLLVVLVSIPAAVLGLTILAAMFGFRGALLYRVVIASLGILFLIGGLMPRHWRR
jgi:hypothetical protein